MKSPSPYFKSYTHLFVCLFHVLSGPLSHRLPEEGTGSVITRLYLEHLAGTQWMLNAHLMNNWIHSDHQLLLKLPSSCHHHPTDYSPLFSPVLTDTSAFSSVGWPWDPHRLDTIVQATRVHDVYWQGEEWGRQRRGGQAGESGVLKGPVSLPQTHDNPPTCACCGPDGRGGGSCLGAVWGPGGKDLVIIKGESRKD